MQVCDFRKSNVGLLIPHFGPDQNISPPIGQIPIKNVLWKIKPNASGDILFFVQRTDQSFYLCEISNYFLEGLAQHFAGDIDGSEDNP